MNKKLITSIICIATTITVLAQVNDKYLENNKAIIDINGIESFPSFSTDFYNNQIFLFGESHGSSQPHNVDFLFFKHLYQKEKVRIYIAEVDQAKAWMLNNFLQDGNENWLEKVFKSWKAEGAQWANTSNWNKYKQLHLFYKTLPKKQKFEIIGIDVIQDYSLVKEYLQFLLNNEPTNVESINKFMAITDTVQYKFRRITGEVARHISTEIASNETFKKRYNKNLDAIINFFKNAGYTGNKMPRDSIMFRTFENIINSKKLEAKKMYGFLGFYHTLQTMYDGGSPFAAYLKKHSVVNNIVSLQMFALNAKVLLPYNDQVKKMMPTDYVETLRKQNPDFPITDKYIPYDLSNDNMMMKADGIDELKSVTKENTITIFKLNGENSPYSKSKKLAEITGFQTLKMDNKNAVTTDAFQYIILFRNSKAGIPIL